jgi:predicted permease
MNEWSSFVPAFETAFAGTLKVFVMGFAGFWFLRRQWLSEDGLKTLGLLVALLTLPCQILHRFATRFDPAEFSDWWKYALMGAAVTGVGLLLGRLISARHHDNNEATMLVGFQNAGFFVLPMLQAILPPAQFPRAALLLFVFVIPFNASLWACGSYFLLRKTSFNAALLLTPTFISTIGSVALFGLFHDFLHQFDSSMVWHILFGETKTNGAVGAIQLIGDLTVPLATITLGGSIALNMPKQFSHLTYKRATIEVAFIKMLLYPLLGYFLLRAFLPPVSAGGDLVVWVLLMLQFAAPPAVNTGVFASQHGYSMRYIPIASLVCYVLGLLTVPFWVALAMR